MQQDVILKVLCTLSSLHRSLEVLRIAALLSQAEDGSTEYDTSVYSAPPENDDESILIAEDRCTLPPPVMCMPTLFMSLAMAQPTQRAVWGALTSSQRVKCWLERKVFLVATSDPVSCLALQQGRFGAQRCCDWGHLSRSSGFCHGSCTGCAAMALLQHLQPASAPHKLENPSITLPSVALKAFCRVHLHHTAVHRSSV